jgi:hypothetical protein
MRQEKAVEGSIRSNVMSSSKGYDDTVLNIKAVIDR